MKQLSPKQQLFVIEYTKDFNGTQAAIRAGYSKKTAMEQASRLLRNVKVQNSLSRFMKHKEEKSEKKGNDVVKELVKQAFTPISEFLTFDNDSVILKNLEDIPIELHSCIQSVKITSSKEGVNVEFKLHDKLKALELLGKHFGLFKEIVEIKDRYEDHLKALWQKIEAAQKGNLTLKIAGMNQVICINPKGHGSKS